MSEPGNSPENEFPDDKAVLSRTPHEVSVPVSNEGTSTHIAETRHFNEDQFHDDPAVLEQNPKVVKVTKVNGLTVKAEVKPST